jgi:hypothetical protein
MLARVDGRTALRARFLGANVREVRCLWCNATGEIVGAAGLLLHGPACRLPQLLREVEGTPVFLKHGGELLSVRHLARGEAN